MGHAILRWSDPAPSCSRKFARNLAASKEMLDEFQLYEAVERLTPEVFHGVRGRARWSAPTWTSTPGWCIR